MSINDIELLEILQCIFGISICIKSFIHASNFYRNLDTLHTIFPTKIPWTRFRSELICLRRRMCPACPVTAAPKPGDP